MRKVHNRLNWSCLIIGASLFSLLATPAHTQNPPGSYQNSCFGIYPNAVGNVLAATCQMTSGQWQWTALPNFSQCIGDITNFDGTLGCNIGGQPPSGSYTQTCRFSWVNGTALNAECKTPSGQWQWTALPNFRQCIGDIANFDGTLGCKMSGQPSNGSYTKFCSKAWVNGSTLNAECQTTSGQLQWTALPNFSQCIGDIANFDGTLGCNIGGQPPSGSYTQTCRFSWVNGTALNAECKTTSGQWQRTQLQNFNQCLQPPANLDGALVCKMAGQPPSGSYTQTCRSAWVDGNTLIGECQTTSGQWQWTTLPNFSQCIGDIANFDGTLACNIGGQPPTGGYTFTCRFAWVNGTTLNAECQTPSGQWQWKSMPNFKICPYITDLGPQLTCGTPFH